MWKRLAAGRVLTFHLAGINNQNFLMRDEETGTFWQQVTGRAVAGPLRGQALELISTDEVSFAAFREESPRGTVLAPVAESAQRYEKKDWERQMSRVRTVLSFPETGIEARELVLGVSISSVSRAYLAERVLQEAVVQDQIGGTPVVLVVGPDGTSVRAFVSRIAGRETQFFREQKPEWSLLDSQTASRWNFRGCAVAGPAQGTCLESVGVLKDYWFDWRNYHPDTTVYRR